MQITIDIPEDLEDFIGREAQKETIPVIFYVQRYFVEHYRQKKEYSEEMASYEAMKKVDGFENEEEARKSEYEENKKLRREREERGMKMFMVAIEAVQSFTEAMIAQTDLAAATARAFDRVFAEVKEPTTVS